MVQAGASEAGRQLAAETAEVVFAAGSPTFSTPGFSTSDDTLNIGVGVSCCQEARKSFEKMNPFFPQVVVKQAAEAKLGWKTEVENTGEILDMRGHLFLL